MSAATNRGSSAALAHRLRLAARVLLGESETTLTAREDAATDWADAAVLLERLVRLVQDSRRPDHMWLLYVTVSTTFPTPDELTRALRAFEMQDTDEAMLWLLDETMAAARSYGTPELEFEIVTDGVIVEVDFSSRHDIHTGIQRVVRSTVPRWVRDHDLQTAAWTDGRAALRSLLPSEHDRIVSWGHATGSASDPAPTEAGPAWKLLVPWRSTVVLPEVPSLDTCNRLTALASSSGNRVVAVGYDAIPVVSADLVPLAEPNRFVRYLTVMKYVERIAGISVSATTEFQGFSDMLINQGMTGPQVLECALPVDAADAAAIDTPMHPTPVVLCVGSFEPRKNQLAVLYAAEVLWREGLQFELKFIGGGGWDREFPHLLRRLSARGRPVSMATAISDEELQGQYRRAWFTVFTSVHEGYGLPVAESLALGTPVITTNYGSTREIGLSGGTVMVDPRDDEALVDAMRSLLTDREKVEKLREEIRHRPVRSWDDYARELWQLLVMPESSVPPVSTVSTEVEAAR